MQTADFLVPSWIVSICYGMRQGCKWDVWCRDRDETEMLEWWHRDETETLVPPVLDKTELRCSKHVLRCSVWAVTNFNCIMCRPIYRHTLLSLYPRYHSCFYRPQHRWFKLGLLEASGFSFGISYNSSLIFVVWPFRNYNFRSVQIIIMFRLRYIMKLCSQSRS